MCERKILILLIILPLILLISCKEEKKEIKAPPPQATMQGAVIFLDTSMSMRGYFKDTGSPATGIQRFLQADIRNILSEKRLRPVRLSRFGQEIGDPVEVSNLLSLFVYSSADELRKFFSGTQTNLIGVLNREDIGNYQVSIIITDGIQADQDGFNIGEMLQAIENKIKKEVHLYLIGIKSAFDGYIYPECPNNYGSKPSFPYTGPRPIYLWIASFDEKMGNDLLRDFIERLRDTIPDASIRTVSLSDTQLPSLDNIELQTISPNYKITPRGNGMVEIRLSGKLRREDIDIPIVLTSDSENGRDNDLWQIKIELEQKKKWAAIVEDEDGRALNLMPDSISSSLWGGNNLRLTAAVVPNENSWWWKKWSTPCDSEPEDADKTLFLDKLGKGIIEPLYNKKHILKTSLNLEIIK